MPFVLATLQVASIMCRGVGVSAEERESRWVGGWGGGLPVPGEQEDFPAHPSNGST